MTVGRKIHCGGFGARWTQRAVAVTCLLALNACSGDDDASPGTGVAPLEFGDCPADLPGSRIGRECGVANVPLRGDERNGKRIEVTVARYPSKTPGHGQLWLLD